MTDVFFTVDSRDGHLQLSIGDNHTGYRIAGPKYAGTSKNLLRHKLDKRDVDEIRRYLRKVKHTVAALRARSAT